MSDFELNDIEKQNYSAGRLSSYLYLLRNNSNFRRFWLSGTISQAGDWFNYIAIFVLLTHLTGSGEAVSWFLIAKFIPTTVLGPSAGVVADRFNRKFILIFCDIARIFVVLGYLLVREADQVYLIFLLALLQESLWSFWHPARQAVLPDICQKEELGIANGLSGASWSIMLALGAAAGGFVSAVFGWRTAIVIDSLSFLVSASIMMTVAVSALAKRKKQPFSLARMLGLHDLVEGIRYVAAHRDVAALLMVKSGWAMSGGILVMLTVFGEQVFSTHGSGGLSGILYSMRGLGAAVGPILAWKIFGDGIQPMRRAIGAAFFISAASYLLFSRAPNIAIAGLCVFIGHIGGSIQWVFSTTLLHRLVDGRFRGRVFAAEMGLLTLILSVSTWLTGVALDSGINPRMIVVYLALLFLLPGSCWLLYLTWIMADRRG
jgi:MFS family permease